MGAGLKKELRKRVEEIMNLYDPDPAHAVQVCKLSLQLFDELEGLHGLASTERELLEIAALLHDIGWALTEDTKHHKHSRDLILQKSDTILNDRDRTICALVARYHRKAEPDPTRHRRFAELSEGDRDIVAWLAAILRVADGLDRSHMNCVRSIRCEIDDSRITMKLEAPGGCEAEIWGVERKAGLLKRKSKKDLVFEPC